MLALPVMAGAASKDGFSALGAAAKLDATLELAATLELDAAELELALELAAAKARRDAAKGCKIGRRIAKVRGSRLANRVYRIAIGIAVSVTPSG